MPNTKKITCKEIQDKETMLITELARLLKKENPGPNDFAYSITVHEQLIFLQQVKEKRRYETILNHFRIKNK